MPPNDRYESCPYRGMPVAEAHPFRLEWTAFVHGGPEWGERPLRVLEIGCGDGATLLPMGAFQPTWTLLGIDASRAAIETARHGAVAAEATNVEFLHADFADFPLAPATWDVVIAHGVYSWISPTQQARMRTFLRTALAPDGVAYVSFNAQPGWGVRGRVRDILRANPDLDPASLLDRLGPFLTGDGWGDVLKRELGRLRDARPDYIAHEYLAEHNRAVWLGEFVSEFAADGLTYLGDAQFDQPNGRPYELVRSHLGIAGLRGEELADLVGYRQFRCAVLCRDDAPRRPPASDVEILRHGRFFGSVVAADEPADLMQRREQTFRSRDGIDIVVASPLCKAALLEMTERDPDAATAEEWATLAEARLASAGAPSDAPTARSELEAGLIALWRAGAIDARMRPGRLATEIPPRPSVRPITRYEATNRAALTTPLGTALAAEAADRRLIELIDGRRTIGELSQTLKRSVAEPDEFVASRLAFLARWGLVC